MIACFANVVTHLDAFLESSERPFGWDFEKVEEPEGGKERRRGKSYERTYFDQRMLGPNYMLHTNVTISHKAENSH